MSNTKRYLGLRIQEIRRQQGIKQAELAELIGVESNHISKIECGRCFPSFELLDKIAEKLNKPVSSFLETEHFYNRNEVIKTIVSSLKHTSDEKFRTIYKLIKEIV